jgi:bifunctional UDP-N-acetylglucosamine pyrophosphorylase/glucosamine-1-phosphate N-acetyltransferase
MSDSRDHQRPEDTVAIVLAAGPGKRMGGGIPKVLVELEGVPLVIWVIRAIAAVGIKRSVVVVGHRGEQVIEALKEHPVEFVWQHERLGTAHAVQQAEPLIRDHQGPLAVLLGDVPRIRPETIRNLISTHCQSKSSATVLSAMPDNPFGYGRIVRGQDGALDRIVEERDADDKIKKINEINTGTMCFFTPDLLSVLPTISNDNAQGEYYLTDAIGQFLQRGLKVSAHCLTDPNEGTGVNSPDQLANLQQLAARNPDIRR